ncbi:MAG: GGDEF domain-containing protein [Spirochaetales bacterium]
MLWYTSRAKLVRHHAEDRIYAFLVFGVMLACFMEALSYTIDGKLFYGARLINYIANIYLYSVNLLLPFCVLIYIDLGLYGNKDKIWDKFKPQIIIGIFMFLMNIVNFIVPISYVITDQNVYERRPFSYEKENGAKSFFNIKMFLMPILLGAGLQFMVYGLSLAWLSASVGLVGLFMMQQNELAYVDGLTDTYNRQYMNVILTSWIRKGKNFVGAMMDMDGFKEINDNFGHSEGDKALKNMADILKNSRKDHELIFRFAGDEFIVLKLITTSEDLGPYIKEVNNQLEIFNKGNDPYKLGISYGISRFNHGSIDSFMRELDTKMYEMKASHHESYKNHV